MKIRMLMTITGTFHGIETGVKTGDVIDIDEFNAIRYCKLGYAEPVTKSEVVVERSQAEWLETAETATVKEVTVKAEPPRFDGLKPLDEPEDSPQPAKKAPARAPRR